MSEGRQFGGVPERFKEEGVFVHGREKVCAGDTVEAIRNVAGVINAGVRARIVEILIDPNENDRGFLKRLRLEGYEGEFNPKLFRKVTAI